MTDYIDDELRPLVAQLRRRYPGVRIVEATMGTLHDGTPQQDIRFQAPLAELQRLGLVTDEMLRLHKAGRCDVSIGDGFFLTDYIDDESRPDCWDVSIWTPARPRERPNINVSRARQVLRRIAKFGEATKK